jgi:Tfp pilus assembly protein PilN
MNRLEIDFAGRGRRAPWASRILVAVALALSVDVALSYRALRSDIAAAEAQLARAQPTAAAARQVAPEELAAVRETLERLALRWDRLFGALEAATSEEVALLGIEPDAKAGTVQISGDSKNYLATLTYVLSLSRAEALSRVQLVRHEVKANDPQAPVGFTVSAAWSGGKP